MPVPALKWSRVASITRYAADNFGFADTTVFCGSNGRGVNASGSHVHSRCLPRLLHLLGHAFESGLARILRHGGKVGAAVRRLKRR